MPERLSQGRVNAERLSAYLRALALPSRIELLLKLRVPHTVAEVHLRPVRAAEGRRPDRALSWQTVERHIRSLQHLGLVRARPAQREGRRVTEYVVDHVRLFLVVEELRQLGLIRPLPGAGLTGQTAGLFGDAGPGAAPALPEGPALVLAGGPMEGAAFSLDGQGPWIIGRAKGLAVSLPYDPFVSTENSEVRREGARFLLRTLPGSRNGTWLNWRRLEPPEEAALGAGDAVGVGRSVLLFRGA